MPSALSVDLRERVVHAIAVGAPRYQAAERFGISLASASRWRRQSAREGHVAPKPQGGEPRSHRIEAHADLILALYEEKPGIFLHEVKASLAERGVGVTQSGLSRVFKRHSITRKRMARPVCKRVVRGDLTGLRQRIRSRGRAPGQDGGPRTLVLIKDTASSAIFCARVPGCRINRQAISRQPPADMVDRRAGPPRRSVPFRPPRAQPSWPCSSPRSAAPPKRCAPACRRAPR